jgi:hypothetical protein
MRIPRLFRLGMPIPLFGSVPTDVRSLVWRVRNRIHAGCVCSCGCGYATL